ncbi:hypothetical protein GpartN1_g5410.t1 [Galdieria partita]|uniref:Uncharacterized protein n=1 Tax=Galdieria partita TaxID=83374 RepID=A0A9C7PZV3_9RHOD|nr:hypothetical protein GpartN1_g5410.t1 [Galdieria partita]
MEIVLETGFQVYHRLKRKHFPQLPFQTSLFCPIGVLGPGDLVEITGLSKCGKTQFLYQCTANYILYQLESESYSRELQLVWIDLDWSFDTSRIRVLLQSSGSTTRFDESQLSETLDKLQICHPQDDWQLLLCLSDLQEQIEISGKFYVIFIDGIGGWQQWNSFTSQVAVLQACFMKLNRLLVNFPVTCLASVKLQMPLPFRLKATSGNSESPPEYLPQPWKQMVSQKLVTFRHKEEKESKASDVDTFFIDHFTKTDNAERTNLLKGWKLNKQWKMKVTSQRVLWETLS